MIINTIPKPVLDTHKKKKSIHIKFNEIQTARGKVMFSTGHETTSNNSYRFTTLNPLCLDGSICT